MSPSGRGALAAAGVNESVFAALLGHLAWTLVLLLFASG
jgi:hypothetical protein